MTYRLMGMVKVCLALGLAIAPPLGRAGAADALPYLFEQLKKPAYRSSLDAILRGQSKLPGWIGVFMKTMNGVANPGSAVNVEGQPFELYSVCEPHNCGGNFLYVLYTPGGGQAFGLVTKDDKVVAVLGNPNPAQRQALTDATQE